MSLAQKKMVETQADNMYSKDGIFWKTYVSGRPSVPNSFFERIFQYHAEHGGHFATVHDVGAGGGVHSARLAKRFNHVIVTDSSDENIAAAKNHLSDDPKYVFHQARMEKTGTLLGPGSVDLIFASSMLHWCDVARALEAAALQLRPGGSLVLTAIGLCRFLDELVQRAHENLTHSIIMQIVRRTRRAVLPALMYNAMGYDNVALPSEDFEQDSVRWRINEPITDVSGGTYYYTMVPPELREELPPHSQTGSAETLVHDHSEEWAFEKDFDGLMGYYATLPVDMNDDEMKQGIKALEDAVAGRVVKGEWVVYTVLATRKRSSIEGSVV